MADLLIRCGAGLAVAGAVHGIVNAALLRRASPATPRRPVSVLVPARDEADRIVDCLRSLAGQPDVGEIVVLDDGSGDDTARVAGGLGARVVPGEQPPPGWLGKPWACAQLADAVADDVLVFLDADVRLEPGAISAALALLDATGLDVICPFPRQVSGSVAERLVQPLLVWSWLTTLPLRLAENSSRRSLTAACGQFVVVRRGALERAGGFRAVRGEVLDDIALVRAIKAAGGRGGVVDGSRIAACRMYSGWPELRAGYTKSLWSAFGSPAGALAVIATLAVAYVVPPLAMLRGSRAGALGYAAAVASRLVAGRVSPAPAADAVAHPISVLTFAWLTLGSLRARRNGTLTWRGRPIPHSPSRRRRLEGGTRRWRAGRVRPARA